MPPIDPKEPRPDDAKPVDQGDLPVSGNLERRVDSFMLISLAIGLALMAGSKMFAGLSDVESRLILVMGLGTVLGALGSAAVVRHKAIIITGGAALGLVLGWFLSGEIDKERRGQFGKFAQIQVRGLPNNARVAMIADSSFFHRERGFAAARLRFHELIATENQLTPDSFVASVTLPASAESDAGGGPLDIPFNCIPTAPVRAVLGVKESVRWVFKYDPETGVSTLSEAADNTPSDAERLEGRVVASSTDCPDMAFSADEPSQQSFFFGITKAFAADIPIGKAIDWLEADSPLSRREARNALIGRGIPAVQPMMNAFSKPGSSYRTRLGSLVALNGMLHRKDITAGEVQTVLSNTDINNIVKMSAVKDATMRRHASNVLAKLDDPRTVDAILSTIPHASDAAQSDLIAAIRPTYKKLSDDRKEAIAERLKRLTRDRPAQTRALIEQTTKAGLPNAEEEKFYVVVGAFTKLANAQRLSKWIGKKSSQKAAVTKQRPGDPLYRVVVGEYAPRAEAEEIKQSVLASGVVKDVFLSNYPDVLRK